MKQYLQETKGRATQNKHVLSGPDCTLGRHVLKDRILPSGSQRCFRVSDVYRFKGLPHLTLHLVSPDISTSPSRGRSGSTHKTTNVWVTPKQHSSGQSKANQVQLPGNRRFATKCGSPICKFRIHNKLRGKLFSTYYMQNIAPRHWGIYKQTRLPKSL